MVHFTKEKGDLAAVLVMADLTTKGFYCFIPVVTEHLPFDLIAYKDGKCYRIQSKYSDDGFIKNVNSWSDRKGTHKRKYNHDDFDYYGLYLPKIDKIIYPSIKFGGAKIAFEISNSATPFYWWEDFIHLTDQAFKKSYKDFGVSLTRERTEKVISAGYRRRKTSHPTKDDLEKLIWQKPMIDIAKIFGVSGKTIAKWASKLNIHLPPQGFWLTNQKQ